MFKKINSIIGSIIKNQKPNKERIEIEGVWEKEVSQKIKEKATIVEFNRGILTIQAANPTWRMELSLIAKEIKKKLIKKQKQK